MKPLEHGQMLKEIFEERLNSLSITDGYYSALKEEATTEKEKVKYDILMMEATLCLSFLSDRLGALSKVLAINEKIQNVNLSFTEKLECMMEVMEIMSDL